VLLSNIGFFHTTNCGTRIAIINLKEIV